MAEKQHTKTKVGIYGGSFNPIHMGHISLAKTLLQHTQLDEIWFMVSPLNPFKCMANDLLDDNRRLELTQIALADEPHLTACDFEFGLPKPSYTYDTLCKLSKTYPEKAFTLIMGADNWASFDRWKNHKDILLHYPIIIYPRKHSPLRTEQLPSTVTLVDTPLYDFNSTDIRRRINHNMSIHGMVKPQIEEKARLYYLQLSHKSL